MVSVGSWAFAFVVSIFRETLPMETTLPVGSDIGKIVDRYLVSSFGFRDSSNVIEDFDFRISCSFSISCFGTV